MNRNKNLQDNDPRILINQQRIEQNHDYFKKYQRLSNLQVKINKLKEQERQRIIHCSNCKRCNKDGLHPYYILSFHNVSSSDIRKQATFKHVISSSGNRETNYTLCTQCKDYLVDKSNNPKNIWPSFLWHVLSMGNKSIAERRTLPYWYDVTSLMSGCCLVL